MRQPSGPGTLRANAKVESTVTPMDVWQPMQKRVSSSVWSRRRPSAASMKPCSRQPNAFPSPTSAAPRKTGTRPSSFSASSFSAARLRAQASGSSAFTM